MPVVERQRSKKRSRKLEKHITVKSTAVVVVVVDNVDDEVDVHPSDYRDDDYNRMVPPCKHDASVSLANVSACIPHHECHGAAG